MAARGKFITFEGLDGSGKSTQIEKLARALRAHGLPVTVTREPGGTATGEKIREVLLHSTTAGLSPLTEMALMFASRAQHVHEVILPALAEGRVVLCDRFTDSTEAYQGGGRKLGTKPVLALHEILCGGLEPDLTVLLDNDVAFSVERARRRNRKHKACAAGKGRESLRTGKPRVFRARAQCLSCDRVPGAAAGACSQCARHAGGDACGIMEVVRKKLKM